MDAPGLSYQRFGIRAGVLLVSVLCLAGAFRQWQTGETYGLSGKGKVYRSKEPAYFAMMFYARIILGCAGLAAGMCLPGS